MWIVFLHPIQQPHFQSTINKTSEAEGTVGSDSASEDEDLEKNAFFTPKKDSRFDDGEKPLENSDKETSSSTSLLHVPSQPLREGSYIARLCARQHMKARMPSFSHFLTIFTPNSRVIHA